MNLSGELASRLAVYLTPLLVSNSSGGALFLRDKYGVPNQKIRIIHNGIALAPPVMNSREWRTGIGVGEDEFVVCMVANIESLQGS